MGGVGGGKLKIGSLILLFAVVDVDIDVVVSIKKKIN